MKHEIGNFGSLIKEIGQTWRLIDLSILGESLKKSAQFYNMKIIANHPILKGSDACFSFIDAAICELDKDGTKDIKIAFDTCYKRLFTKSALSHLHTSLNGLIKIAVPNKIANHLVTSEYSYQKLKIIKTLRDKYTDLKYNANANEYHEYLETRKKFEGFLLEKSAKFLCNAYLVVQDMVKTEQFESLDVFG